MISIVEVGTTSSYAISQMLETVRPDDIIHGLIKSAFFGYTIVILSCWVGMQARGGAESVGKATTNTVVYTSVCILISDFLLTRFLMAILCIKSDLILCRKEITLCMYFMSIDIGGATPS